jgi:Ser/Thr protein kinase RdoA (MazF antagonist)
MTGVGEQPTVSYPARVLDSARIAAEFGLGTPLSSTPLTGGDRDVTRLRTARGTFVVKAASGTVRAGLYEQAALVLSASGIPQARPLRTLAGSLVSRSGHTVEELLPGRICPRPTAAQTVATMRHIAAYHAALQPVTVPAELHAVDTVWDRVASGEYLVQALPALLRAHAPGDADNQMIAAALTQVERALPEMRELPRQLVHGDIGPDNVLMDGDEVIAIIDFTPFFESVLFAVATAVYWYHVHGQRELDPDAIHTSLDAAHRPWAPTERAIWPAMLAREALRRLATPLALSAEMHQPAVPVNERYQAVLSIMDRWTQLQHNP